MSTKTTATAVGLGALTTVVLLVLASATRNQADEIAQLRARVEILERKTKREGPQSPVASLSPGPESKEIQGLSRRVESLESEAVREKQSDPPRQSLEPKANPVVQSLPEVPRVDPKDVPSLRLVCLDFHKSPQERINAFMQLRLAEFSGAEGARSRDVVLSMIQLMESSTDADVRQDVMRHIKGAIPDDLTSYVTGRLRTDPSDAVRAKAADALAPLNGNPDVKIALQYALANDPSSSVQRAVQKSLSSTRK